MCFRKRLTFSPVHLAQPQGVSCSFVFPPKKRRRNSSTTPFGVKIAQATGLLGEKLGNRKKTTDLLSSHPPPLKAHRAIPISQPAARRRFVEDPSEAVSKLELPTVLISRDRCRQPHRHTRWRGGNVNQSDTSQSRRLFNHFRGN